MAAKRIPIEGQSGYFQRGSRVTFAYRDASGKQRWATARNLTEAKRKRRSLETDRDRGELHLQSRRPFRGYAEEWIESYQGLRRSTRDDYRRRLEAYAYPFFGRRSLAEIDGPALRKFVAWLCDEQAQERRLSDSTIRNIVAPVRSCLGTAVEDELIRRAPAVKLPRRSRVVSEEPDEVRVFTAEQLALILELVHPEHRLLFHLLASTGLRVSELFGLSRQHLHLNGSAPHLKVRRAWVRGRWEDPKSRFGRRDVPLGPGLVAELRAHLAATESGEEAILFPSSVGTPLHYSNMRRRHLIPVVEEVGAPWAGFHTFRHTCASMLFAQGKNAVQVQRWLGHHSASFTLDTYIHLLDGDLGEPLTLPAASPLEVVTEVVTEPVGTRRHRAVAISSPRR
ncbi:MAG: site-specific integrase [Actinomycetota bacterium]|nr:site-specific integrase [Actinomycetota bacterium]